MKLPNFIELEYKVGESHYAENRLKFNGESFTVFMLSKFIKEFFNTTNQIIRITGYTEVQLDISYDVAKEIKPWQFMAVYEYNARPTDYYFHLFEVDFVATEIQIKKGQFK